uniref:non-specific serine/threonine protein kinase n=1 Tax=Tetranychus urticae TaxID=32264 RepID=T1KH83_TETUR
MGNHLSGVVPVQIHPTEYYISDIANSELITFDGNLGSTRFFKVARVKLHQIHAPGLGVAKVFVINDPTLHLKGHKEVIDWLKEALKDNPNALVFSKAVINEKAAVLLRQYIKFNLYDRISTRPFLTFFEKTWIAFQLLKCCEWIHEKGICHGDIKLENILITSYLWVLLTDFATFKPVFLPEDNPADFSYFFDTSRRRTCNVAPERFIQESYTQGDLTPPGYIHSSMQDSHNNLKPAMDMFSLGCVIAELFTEDSSNGGLFDLSALLSFRSGERCQNSFNKIIDSIPDKQIRDLVSSLTDLDPKQRKSASYHLKNLTPSLFPHYFNDLFIFFKDIIKLPPDEKIIKMANKLKAIIPLIKKEDSKGLLLIIVLVTSIMRSMKHLHAKIIALEVLSEILNCDMPVISPHILDRILPYLMVMLRDSDPRVRAEAIFFLTYCLSTVEKVPPCDSNVFPDYILPNLTQLAKDRSILVRMALARHLADLADIASRFSSHTTHDKKHFQNELAVLHSGFQIMVANILTDSASAVKINLLSNNISKLCKFFGPHKTNELILSHIFTFLNEADRFELRCAFFDNVVPIAEYLGSQCLSLLKPFLQQGISDTEETVISKTLFCLANLTKLKLWDKTSVLDILSESIPLLCHPNIWIRHSLIYFIHLLAVQLSPADVYCKIMPLLAPYVTKEIFSLENTNLLLDNLKTPLPRSVFDMIVQPSRFASLHNNSFVPLIECLKERKRIRSLGRSGNKAANEVTCPLLNAISNQVEDKLTEEQEEQILKLSTILRKINREYRARAETDQIYGNIIQLNRKNRKTHSMSLSEMLKNYPLGRRNYQSASGINMNEEWHTMFGSQKDSIEVSQEILDVTVSGEKSADLNAIPVAQEAKENILDDYGQQLTTCPPCINDLHGLMNHKKNYFTYHLSDPSIFDNEPRTLLGQLHEHSKQVNRIAVIDPTTLFVTCSSDATLKVWDALKVEDRNCMINRSKQSFRLSDETEEFKAVTYLPGVESLVCYTNTNAVYVLQLDPSSSKMRLQHRMKDYCCEGTNLVLTDLCSISPNVFAISNTASQLIGCDLRQPPTQSPAFSILAPLARGMVTCIDGNEYLLSCGTSRGLIINYDLRFILEANSMFHSKDKKKSKRVMRILITSNAIYSSVQGNNEVAVWNCGTGERMRSYWASDLPALCQENRDNALRSVNGMVVLNRAGNECLITGGTDFKIRYWDYLNINNNGLISDSGKPSPWPYSPPLKNYQGDYSVHYESKMMEGCQVIQEHKSYRQPSVTSLDSGFPHSASSSSLSVNSLGSAASIGSSGLIWEQQAVSLAHKASITDLVWINKMNLLISSSSDGCVKVWR